LKSEPGIVEVLELRCSKRRTPSGRQCLDRKHFAIGIVALAFAACLSSGVGAQPSIAPDAAAKTWLSFVDGADYAKSWDRAGTPLRARITSKDWRAKVAPVREPIGAIMERKFLNVTVSSTMPGLPDGKYVVIQYNSRFAKKTAVIETVEMVTEDNRWTVIGYFIN
jgi:Protein of unknown function (DUF4019)